MGEKRITDKEKIERLEQMVMTLTECLLRVTHVVNTGSYEYNLGEVRMSLDSDKVHEYRLPE